MNKLEEKSLKSINSSYALDIIFSFLYLYFLLYIINNTKDA